MKKVVVILTVALGVVGGGAIHLWRQLDAERQVNTELQARIKAMEAVQQSLSSAFAMRSQVAAGAAEPQATAAPADPVAARAQRQQGTQLVVGNAMARARETLATPEGRQAITGMMRAMIPLALPDVAKVLNLSQAEADKLFELIAKQGGGALDQLGGGASMQERTARAEETRQKNEAEIAALLGSKYPQWQEYEESLPLRQQVNQLQTALGATGNKLAESQTGPLIAALSAEQKRINQETGNVPAAPGMTPQERRQQRQQQTAGNNQRMADAASPYMTSQQLDAYKATLERQNTLQGLLGGLAGARGGATPPR